MRSPPSSEIVLKAQLLDRNSTTILIMVGSPKAIACADSQMAITLE